MIELRNLTKSFRTLRGRKYVARDLNLVFPNGSAVALLGRNGSGKTTLLQMISGNMRPDSGRIITDGHISFPVGFAGSFHKDLTGAQNIRFIARVYGVDTDELLRFVEDFAELGDHFHMPVRHYSAGMRSRLAFGVSMGIEFDTYLVDEITAVGDQAFREKSSALFRDRMRRSNAIVVTHSLKDARRLCRSGVVLEQGQLHYFDDLEDAITLHLRNLKKI